MDHHLSTYWAIGYRYPCAHGWHHLGLQVFTCLDPVDRFEGSGPLTSVITSECYFLRTGWLLMDNAFAVGRSASGDSKQSMVSFLIFSEPCKRMAHNVILTGNQLPRVDSALSWSDSEATTSKDKYRVKGFSEGSWTVVRSPWWESQRSTTCQMSKNCALKPNRSKLEV